jgi:hypothetical protein
MKKLTELQKQYIYTSLDPRANAIMNMVDKRPDLCWDAQIEELELIKSIFEYMVDDEEMTAGVITVPKSQLEDAIEFATQMVQQTEPRTIGDIYSELSNHPDFVAGSYYDKDSVIDIIANEIGDDYDDDDKLFKDAEEIYENNARQIFKNIDNAYDYGMEHVDFTEGCDLTLEKQIK